jgi:hypothetical protein
MHPRRPGQRRGAVLLSSLGVEAPRFAHAVRSHWRIENHTHFARDISMGEDARRIRSGAAPRIMAAFRNAAVGFPHCQGVVNVAEASRRNAAQVRLLLFSLSIVKQ